MKRLALLLLLTGCGETTLLEPGTYPIIGTYTRDDWPGGEVGATFENEFTLEVREGEPDVYLLTVNSTVASGLEDDGIIYFSKVRYDDKCDVIDSFFDTVLVPDGRRAVTGNSHSMISLCNVDAEGVCSCSELWIIVDLVGRKK